VFNR
jgi:hypothetical protein